MPVTTRRHVRVRHAGVVHQLELVPYRVLHPRSAPWRDGLFVVLRPDGTEAGGLRGCGTGGDVAGPWIVRAVDPATGKAVFPRGREIVTGLLGALRALVAAG